MPFCAYLCRANSFDGIYQVARANLTSKSKILDVGDYNISETITTTETWVAPFGSVTLPDGHSKNETRISLTVSEIFDRKQEPWTRYFFILLLAVRIHSNGYWFRSLVQVSIPKFWCWRLHISETIWTTETSFAPFGSATIALGHSENRTKISPTVSEIFDRKNSPERGYFFILLFIIILLSDKSKATYLLLQEWSDPGNFDIISKLGIRRREFLILAGKFQLVDSLWGK